MNRLTRHMFACVLGLFVAVAGHAMESTASGATGMPDTSSVYGVKYDSLLASIKAIFEDYDSTIDQIIDCQEKKQFWNGTKCVKPDDTEIDIQIKHGTYRADMNGSFAGNGTCFCSCPDEVKYEIDNKNQTVTVRQPKCKKKDHIIVYDFSSSCGSICQAIGVTRCPGWCKDSGAWE